MRKLKQMAILVMTILTFSSCYNRIIPILPPPSIDKEPQHIHSFSNEPMDYEINGTTIVAIYTCECGETKSQVISNDMITADDNNIETLGDDVYVVVTPENYQEVIDNIGDNAFVVFSKGTYDKDIIIRPSVRRSMVYVNDGGEFDPEKLYTGEKFIQAMAENEGYKSAAIRAERRLCNATFFAEDGAVFTGALVMNNSNEYDNIRGQDWGGTETKYMSFFYVENLKIVNWHFQNEGHIEIQPQKNPIVDKPSSFTNGVNGVGIVNCQFDGQGTNAGNVAILSGNTTPDTVKNIRIIDSVFTNWYQGLYTGTIRNCTISGCTFADFGHNAIALQGTNNDSGSIITNTGLIEIKDSKFINNNDRSIGRGDFVNAEIVIEGNSFINSGDVDNQIVKLGNDDDQRIRNCSFTFKDNYAGDSEDSLVELEDIIDTEYTDEGSITISY